MEKIAILGFALWVFYLLMWALFPSITRPLQPLPPRKPRREYITCGDNIWYQKECPTCGGDRYFVGRNIYCPEGEAHSPTLRLDGRE